MNRFRRYEVIEESPPFCIHQTIPLNPFCPSSYFIDDHFDFVTPCHYKSQYLFDTFSPRYDDFFDPVNDLVLFENNPFLRRVRHHHRRVGLASDLYSVTDRLCDRVSALEFDIDQLANARRARIGERKYCWTTEIRSPERQWLDRKYKWVAPQEKSYKFTAEIKGRGDNFPVKRTYKYKSSPGHVGLYGDSWDRNMYGKKNWRPGTSRLVEINDPYYDHGANVLRQAFARRVERIRGKRKELSLQDSAVLIQRTFRGYLLRRSQALRGLRDLAIAKAKLKEIRAWFNNFSYRCRVVHDAEERQRFTERIIVLLLTVDAIQAGDLMVRRAKRSIVYELEGMLDVIDPDSSGRLQMRRRTFDMPDGGIQKEVAAGVAQIVQMIEEEG